LQIVRTAAGKSGDWGALYLAVSSVRTLLVHHDEVFSVEQGGEADGIRGLVGLVVPIVTDAVSHNRSAIQSVGLRCLEELFRCASGEVGAMLLGNELEQLVRAAGACYRASKTFILTAGKKAMDAAAEKADPILLLSAVLPQGLDKHQKVSAEALVLADKCLSRLNVGDVPGGGMPDGLDMKLLVEALAKGARCRVSSAKEAASRSLERRVCRNAWGAEKFATVVGENTDQSGARAIHDLLATEQRRREKRESAASGSRTGTASFPRRSAVVRGARESTVGSTRGTRGRVRAAIMGGRGSMEAKGGVPASAQDKPSS
ncbi:unnamed protein product, partial [Hapterophycus canaliculatus]